MKRVGLLFLIGYAASAAVAHAATYYVAKTGNNNNSCAQAQSTSTPKQTVAAGLACLVAGDTLPGRGGTYEEGIVDNVPSGTSWSNKVRIAAYSGETVWLTPRTNVSVITLRGASRPVSYVEFDGINLDGRNTLLSTVSITGAVGSDAHHIRIQNAHLRPPNVENANGVFVAAAQGQPDGPASNNAFLNLTIVGGGGGSGDNANGYSFYLGSSGNLIDGCDVSDSRGGGIHVYRTGNTPSNNIIRNTRVHDITRSKDDRMFGIILNGNNNQVYNNLIYRINFSGSSSNTALVVYTGSGHKLWNNTVAYNTTEGIKVSGGASNTEVRNNIAYGNSGSAFVNEGAGTAASNNLFGVDPLFVNPSGNDFQLKDASRAVDAGVSLPAVTTDLSGVARPQGSTHDIGAYEYRGQAAASGPPAPPTGVRIVSQ